MSPHHDETWPLSESQSGIWFAQQADPATPMFVNAEYHEIEGPLDAEVLARAVDRVVEESENLRLRFIGTDSGPVQYPDPSARRPLRVVDLSGAPDPRGAALEWMRQDVGRAPDPYTDDLCAFVLFRIGEQHHLWYVRAHHLVVDGYTFMLLARRTAEVYTDLAAGADPLPAFGSFRELLDENLRYRTGDEGAADRAYWEARLAGAPSYTSLTGRVAPPSHHHLRSTSVIGEEGLARIEAAAARIGTGWKQVLMAAAAVYTRQWSGEEDVLLSLPVAARATPLSRRTPGMQSNVVPLRCSVTPGTTFAELARTVAADLRACLPHQRHPIASALRMLGQTADARHECGPIVNIMAFDYGLSFAGLHATSHNIFQGPIEELRIDILQRERGGPLHVDFDANPAVFSPEELERHRRSFEALVEQLCAAPDTAVRDADGLDPADRLRQITEFNATGSGVCDRTAAEVFGERVREAPDAVAVVFGEERLTYAELDERANRLAHHLVARGVARGEVVAVLLERGPDLAVSVLAAVKAGAPYLLLDPAFPDERLGSLVEGAGARHLVTCAQQAGRVSTVFPPVAVDTDAEVIASRPGAAPGVPLGAADGLCVMFTSGSTGRPKGVLVPHRAVVGTLRGQDFADFGADQVWLQSGLLSWDVFALEFWGSLLNGARCVLQPGRHTRPELIEALVAEHGVTTLWLSAGLFNLMLDEYPRVFSGVRQVMTGGEAPSVEHLRRFREMFPGVRLVHGYGPVEAMIFTNAMTLDDMSGDCAPVGRPLSGKRVYVLDERLRPLPVGVAGEVYAAGVGLADGYLGQPVATAERFLPDPFGGPGERMYRTGDLGRWTEDGHLVVVGRADGQVKIRGFRIEPGEVETAFTALPQVAAAVVTAHGGTVGEKRLVAYVVPEPGADLEPVELRARAAEVLPEHMVPSAVVPLDALPLNDSGKLDRRALPEPDFGALSRGRAARDAREEVLCGLFAEVLGLESVTIDDSFFDLGGHSLLAARLIARMREVFGSEVTLREVFARPTVAALAEQVADGGPRAPELPAVVPVDRPERVPLSFAQRRLWFLDRLEGPNTTYNIPVVLRLSGAVDAGVLEAALGDVVERHESLRTVFREAEGEPYQHVLDPGPAREALVFEHGAEAASSPVPLAEYRFDLSAELPVRARLAEEPSGWCLELLVHHIAGDGASMGPLLRDLEEAYRARNDGQAPAWEPLEVQYADYALWQREWLGSSGGVGSDEDGTGVLSRQVEYWRTALEGAPEELALPWDRVRPAVASHRGGFVPLALPDEVGAALERVARAHGCTLHMVLQAAVAVALSRLGAGPDIPLGTPVAGRSGRALEDLVGFFVNTVVSRVDVSGDPSLGELLGRVRDRALVDLEHGDVPFDVLVEELNPVRSAGRNPLFQVMLTLEHDTLVPLDLGGTSALPELDPGYDIAKFDLELSFSRTSAGALRGRVGYAVDLFEESTVRRLAGVLVRVLEQMVRDTSASVHGMDVVSDSDRAALEAWNATGSGVADRTVAEVFEEHARRDPGAVAVVFGEERLTYAELDERANRLAHHLLARGAAKGDVVAILLERGPDLAVGVLAAAKAGTPYLLLDPGFPDERLRSLAESANTRYVIGRELFADRVVTAHAPVLVDTDAEVIASRSGAAPDAGVGAGDPFGVIFTSGSTGRPKGVLTSHRAVVGTFLGQDFVDLSPDQVWLQCAPVSWDGFVLEFWGALLSGAACVLQPERSPEPGRIAELVVRESVTTLWLSAGLFNLLLDEYPRVFSGVRQVMTGGEAPSVEHLRRFREAFPPVRLVHGYGPAEAMIFTNAMAVEEVSEGRVPVGRPLAGKRVYVLDGRLRQVPVGVVGEVYAAGVGLADGYLGQPVATAERFLPDPFGGPGERMYRTGDLGKWTEDGHLVVVGRADGQVKIRGFRIEPGEIETALAALPQVAAGVVTVHEDSSGDRRLVGYAVPADDSPRIDGPELRSELSAVLPEHMVPSAVVVVDRLPLTPNGKVDRRALPEPDFGALSRGRAARDAREELLCGLFAEVLELESVTIDDSFFDLGGHSLLAARLMTRIRSSLGVEITLKDLFQTPTVAELAAMLREGGRKDGRRPQPRRMERPERIPLSYAQRRLWFLDRLEGPNTTYNIPVVLRLSGTVDAGVLEAALGDVVERHEVLRTVFREAEGEPYQHILDTDRAREMLVLDRGEHTDISVPLAEYRFDLSAELPVRARLSEDVGGGWCLELLVHHIAGDGASMGPLLRDLTRAYEARRAGVTDDRAPLAVQYADYALWQREWLGSSGGAGSDEDGGSVLSRQVEYWRTALEGAPEELVLPWDRVRPAVASHRGGFVPISLPEGMAERLERVARVHGCTLHMVLQAAVAVALSRLGAGPDIPLGTPVAGRGEGVLEDLVGFFVNTVVSRVDVSGDPSLGELLGRVRDRALVDLEHGDVPFDVLVEELNPVRSAGRNPLFQVMLTLEHDTFGDVDLGGIGAVVEADTSVDAAKFDLTVAFESDGSGLRGRVGYAVDLFEESTVRRLAGVLVRVLEQMVRDTGASVHGVDVVSDSDRAALEAWNATGAGVADRTVAEVFEEHARRDPGAVAVVFGEERLTYAELDERANRLAHHLVARGVARGEVAAVLLERGPDLAVSVLAAVKAGTPYLLLDPGFPDERLRSLADSAGARMVVTRREEADRVPTGAEPVLVDADAEVIASRSGMAPDAGVGAGDPFGVIFTSGSTGRPKGVLTSHRAVVGTFLGQDFVDLSPDQVWLQCAPVSWDGFVLEFWGALLSGAACVLQPGRNPEPELIEKLCVQHRVTTLWASAGLLNLLLDQHPDTFSYARQVMTGGEAPSVEHLRRFREVFPRVRLVHGYGPAEAMIFTNAMAVEEVPEGRVPVGRPLAGKRVYVLDERLRPLPVGVAGEVYAAGVGLADGYLGRPAETAERFLPDPFGAPGERMYRTGDLGKWTEDGHLVVVGRADGQVKIRGFRIEPGEVETALAGTAGVDHAAVLVHGDTVGEKRLVAYVVPAGEAEVDPAQVRMSASAVLPEHMVPSAVVVVDRLPLTPNGKLDRRALPEPDFGALSRGRAARDAREEVLCGLFAEVLGLESVTIDDSFFDLGGHSLLAARLIARMREVFGSEVGLRDLFLHPTVAALSAVLGEEGRKGGRRPQPRHMERPERIPLSYAQRRLWFLDRLEGPNTTYNIPVVLRLSDAVDAGALEAALGDVVERHESLRTVFRETEGEPYQHILDPGPAREMLVLECARAADGPSFPPLSGHRFDLSAELPVRARLSEDVGGGWCLELLVHHIAGDGASMGPLLRDLEEAYRARVAGQVPAWEPLEVQYADYALWQREWLGSSGGAGSDEDGGSVLSRQVEYWRTALEGAPEELVLPWDRVRPAVASHRGGFVPISLPEGMAERLERVARVHGCTLHMVLQAAVAVALSRLGAGPDIPLGTPVAGRSGRALEDLVGFFVNTVVSRVDVSGDPSLGELLGRVRDRALVDLEHGDVPFDVLVEELNPVRSAGRNPLFQVMLTLRHGGIDAIDLAGVTATPDLDDDLDVAKFDLSIGFESDGSGLRGRVGYAVDLFEESTVRRLAGVLVRVLEQIVRDTGVPVHGMDVVPEQDRRALEAWNATGSGTADRTMAEVFEEHARRGPGAVAVVFGEERLTYAELDERANRLAHHLLARGTARGDVVAILLERGPDLAVSVLAAVKAGTPYLLLDPGFPDERLRSLAGSAGVRTVVTRSEEADRVPTGEEPVLVDADAETISHLPGSVPDARANPADGACVIFTSGSTGRPKGVLTSHRAVVGTFLGQDFVDLSPGQVWLQCAPVSWDGFVLEFWGALLSGAACVLQPERSPEPGRIAELVVRESVTTLWLSAGLFNLLLDEYPQVFAGVLQVMTGGEAPSVEHLRRFREAFPQVRLVHGYGPAEAMIFTNARTLSSVTEGRVPVGGPLAGKRVHVLDERLRPLPVGVVGEVYAAGVGLAHGYLGRPTETAERFLPDPFGGPGERIYRTGDLGKWTEDGHLVVVGRADGQVKIRGFRIEPGEVEAAFTALPQVAAAVVVAHGDTVGEKRLVAYAAPEAGADLEPVELRARAAEALPEHMVPSVVVVVDRIPLTPNGKVDRRALPEPDFGALSRGRAARDAREEVLCGLFAEVLELESVTIDDSFFDLGGHSLLAARLMTRIRSSLGVEITLKDLFQTPTVAELAHKVGQATPAKRARPKLSRRTRQGVRL